MNAIGRRIDRLERGKGEPWPQFFVAALWIANADSSDQEGRLVRASAEIAAEYRAVYGDGGPAGTMLERYKKHEPTKQAN